jgi:hypothetical protein
MANTNSSLITGVGNPASIANVGIMGGKLRFAYDTFRLASNPSDGDTFALCRLPSGCRISSIKLFNDDIDSNGTEQIVIDLGLVDTDLTGGDPDCFMDGDDLFQDANLTGTECRYGFAKDHTTLKQQAWELAGKSADDGKQLVLLLTIPTNSATHIADSDFSFEVQYVID